MNEKIERECFVHRNTKIIISEHFAENGKSIADVIKEAICRETPNYHMVGLTLEEIKKHKDLPPLPTSSNYD